MRCIHFQDKGKETQPREYPGVNSEFPPWIVSCNLGSAPRTMESRALGREMGNDREG